MWSTADIIAAAGVAAVVLGALFGFLVTMAVNIGKLQAQSKNQTTAIERMHGRMSELDSATTKRLDAVNDNFGSSLLRLEAALLEANVIPARVLANGYALKGITK